MVELARLESVYAGNRIEGSNPSPSAILKVWINCLPSLLEANWLDSASILDMIEVNLVLRLKYFSTTGI